MHHQYDTIINEHECEDEGSSITLIFYKVGSDWYKGGEPFLNLVAAVGQMSNLTHVEVAIGECAGRKGEMTNVLRIFNDNEGTPPPGYQLSPPFLHATNTPDRAHRVEMATRTGRNPQYQYLQIGCSKNAVSAMTNWGNAQKGKPFSGSAMARSLFWPRVSTGKSWYCAELVAACLQVGGLMSKDSNSGAATPKSIFNLYKSQGAVHANPYSLRQAKAATTPRMIEPMKNSALAFGGTRSNIFNFNISSNDDPHHTDNGRTPSRIAFRVLQTGPQQGGDYGRDETKLKITLNSLDMSRPRRH